MTIQSETLKNPRKKAYKKPNLVIYGKISITGSGTVSGYEGFNYGQCMFSTNNRCAM